VLVASALAPLVAPADPYALDPNRRLLPPAWLDGGRWDYPLGTDHVGRDILSRVIYGSRISTVVGLSAVAISVTLGVTLGLLAGFYGGGAERVILFFADVQIAFPFYLLAISIIAAVGSGFGTIIVVFGVAGWVIYARVVRGTVLSLKERDFVDAARALGGGHGRVLLRHIEYERCGGIMFALAEDRLALIRTAYAGYRRHGVPVEWHDAAGLQACEPAFRADGILGGVFCPLNGQLNPLMLCRALAEGARRHKTAFVLGTSVEGIEVGGGRVRAVRTSAGDIPCEYVVNAAGAWAADVARMVGLVIPVSPGRGQILITEPVPRFINRIVMGASPSARQTRRGNVIIGSVLEYAGYDKNVTLDTVSAFTRGVLDRFPGVRGLNVIRSWAGLRPMTPDHRPIIQMMEAPRGLCLATGHSHRGICWGAGTGQAVADLVTGRPPRLPLEAFRLERFETAKTMEAH